MLGKWTSILAIAITIIAFAIGMVKILINRKPLYFKLIICSAGCYALEQLSYLVSLLCGTSNSFWIGMIGMFGCTFFLFSADYGVFDKIVDDGSQKKARRQALIAPLLFGTIIIGLFFHWIVEDVFWAIFLTALSVPIIPASYFSLKHILLPYDEVGLLKGTRQCNIIELVFYTVMIASNYAIWIESVLLVCISNLLLAVTELVLVLVSINGVKQWKI